MRVCSESFAVAGNRFKRWDADDKRRSHETVLPGGGERSGRRAGAVVYRGGRKSARSFGVALWLIAALAGANVSTARATFDDYLLVRTFELPAGASTTDFFPDGRVVTLIGDQVHVETSVGSGNFTLHGTLPLADIGQFGAVFLRVSPDGTKLAVGNGGGASFFDFEVGVFDFDTLMGEWFPVDHFDAEWFDGTSLALTAGDFISPSVVSILDTLSDPQNPINPVVVDNIGGGSGGITFDEQDRLYTGNGFELFGPSGTGTVKAFDAESWMPALKGEPPVDFENDGILIVDVLSAAPLGFDAKGNLYVGGGDTEPDFDFVALVNALAVADALNGFGPADPQDPTQVRRLDPDEANEFNFYTVDYNQATNELYLRNFGETTVYVYGIGEVAPTVTAWGMAGMSMLLLSVGTLAIGKRANHRATVEHPSC